MIVVLYTQEENLNNRDDFFIFAFQISGGGGELLGPPGHAPADIAPLIGNTIFNIC